MQITLSVQGPVSLLQLAAGLIITSGLTEQAYRMVHPQMYTLQLLLRDGQVVDVIVTNATGCSATSTPIVVTVIPDNTLTLTSAAGTDAQTVCINTAITPITYSTTGATGATVTNLPTGVTGSWLGNVVTISGTPTVSGAAMTYTVTLTGGCGNVNRHRDDSSHSEQHGSTTSAAGTDAQDSLYQHSDHANHI